VIVAAALPWSSCGEPPRASASPTPGVAESLRRREDALARAKVWRQPARPVAEADLRHDGPGPFKASDRIECRYQLKLGGGVTPKFHCLLPDGRVIKVKYGKFNPEPRTEWAATRLLSTLGFGADHMYAVKRVRCRGCPAYPHPRWGPMNSLFARPSGHVDFEHVAVEDPLPGREIEVGEKQGWAWYELDKVDASLGGASRAELDAFRLMAVFLAAWDNKAENQRLLCLPGGDRPDGGCTTPFAYIQDVGSTFGPKGLDLEAWRGTPVWADAEACRVSMRSLPFRGATFRDAVISERGRSLLAGLLTQLRPPQVRDLFTASGFTEYAGSSPAGRDVENWRAAFDEKVRQIADRPACPEP
jgi:hypothetical protein